MDRRIIAWRATGIAMLCLVIATVAINISYIMYKENRPGNDGLLFAILAFLASLACIYVVVSARRRIR